MLFLYALFLLEDRYGILSAIFFEEVTPMLNDWLFPVPGIYVFTLTPPHGETIEMISICVIWYRNGQTYALFCPKAPR